jgi:Rod binding domain-containing protein
MYDFAVTAIGPQARQDRSGGTPSAGSAPTQGTRMRAAAQAFEATFVAEMLKHTGLGKMPETFNGGAGEAGFSGFLTQEYADLIASTGRIGIADQVYATLKARSMGQ